MHLLGRMKLAHKFAGLLALLGLVTIGASIFNEGMMRDLTSGYHALIKNRLPADADLARGNRRAIELVHVGYKAALRAETGADMDAFVKELDHAHTRGGNNLTDAETTDTSLAPLVDRLRRHFDRMHELSRQAIAQARAGQRGAALATLAANDAELKQFADKLSDAVYARVDESDARTAAVEARGSADARWVLLINLFGFGLALIGGLIFARRAIVAPLHRLRDVMASLAGGSVVDAVPGAERQDEVGDMARAVLVFRDATAAKAATDAARERDQRDQARVVEALGTSLSAITRGDLTADIRDEFPPAYAGLRTNFNAALASLRKLIGAVAESTHAIGTGADEIAQASEDLARRTEGSAASIEESSTALREVDGRLRAVADAASETVTRADQTIVTVDGGRAIADEAVAAMERVASSAKGIDDVIEGLDKIAFQTRVLAMNAAVEAGRAGEAGRGFAVVADLVSALAMRAEEESKRARDQLTLTRQDIGAAVGAVEKVDHAFADISADVAQVHALLATMATDNRAQSGSMTRIAEEIGKIDRSTQQNAAMVEQTSAAARNLSGEVAALAAHAAHFVIEAPRPGMAAPRIQRPQFARAH